MKYMKKRLIRKLPKPIRGRIIRSSLPDFRLNLEGILFRPAVTTDDYIKAFRLLHDVYVEAGYIDPSPSALRIVPQHSHPASRVFLGCFSKNNSRRATVYTSSLFPDSSAGLPMDTAFKNELDILRAQGRGIAEVGCMAADPAYKKEDMNIPMLGNRIVHQYATRYLKADDLVITVHPRYQWVYEDVLLFEKIGAVRAYPYVRGNPAVALRLDLKTARERYKKCYNRMRCEKNLYRYFFCDECSSIVLLDCVRNNSTAVNKLLCHPVSYMKKAV